MGRMKLTIHHYPGFSAKQLNRSDCNGALADGSDHGIEVLPDGIFRIYLLLPFTVGDGAPGLSWEVYSGFVAHAELADPLVNFVYSQFESQPVEVPIARVHDGGVHIRRTVITHAVYEAVPDLDAASACELGVFGSDCTLFHACRGHHQLPCRPCRVFPLNGLVEEGMIGIGDHIDDFVAVLGRYDVGGKNVGVKAGLGDHSQDLAVLRVLRHGDSGLVRVIELVLGRFLHVQVDSEHDILSLNRGYLVEVSNGAAAAVNDDAFLAVLAPQYLIVILFDSVLADYVAGLVTGFRIFRVFEFFRTDFSDIAEHMRSEGTVGV